MNANPMGIANRNYTRKIAKWIAALTLAFIVSLALPGRAADERAVKTRVAPLYPELAKHMRITGTVVVQVTVDPDGKVTAVKTISGPRVLAQAAEDAVQKWRFVPAAESSVVNVELNFSLGQ